ncbi:MAG TPA: hypothetical protein V6D12_07535 [Candidatus Obscuribacterales bacterium]
MKISDLQHLEVISEETKIEGGITVSFGASAGATSAALISSTAFSGAAFAGGTLASSSNTVTDSAAIFDPAGTSGTATSSSSLTSITFQ